MARKLGGMKQKKVEDEFDDEFNFTIDESDFIDPEKNIADNKPKEPEAFEFDEHDATALASTDVKTANAGGAQSNPQAIDLEKALDVDLGMKPSVADEIRVLKNRLESNQNNLQQMTANAQADYEDSVQNINLELQSNIVRYTHNIDEDIKEFTDSLNAKREDINADIAHMEAQREDLAHPDHGDAISFEDEEDIRRFDSNINSLKDELNTFEELIANEIKDKQLSLAIIIEEAKAGASSAMNNELDNLTNTLQNISSESLEKQNEINAQINEKSQLLGASEKVSLSDKDQSLVDAVQSNYTAYLKDKNDTVDLEDVLDSNVPKEPASDDNSDKSANSDKFAEHRAILDQQEAKERAAEKARLMREQEAAAQGQPQQGGSDSAIATIVSTVAAGVGAVVGGTAHASDKLFMGAVDLYRNKKLNNSIKSIDDADMRIHEASNNMGSEWDAFSKKVDHIASQEGVSTNDVYQNMQKKGASTNKDIASLQADWKQLNTPGSDSRDQIDNYNRAIKDYQSTISTAISRAELVDDSDALEEIDSKNHQAMLNRYQEMSYPEKNALGEPSDAKDSLAKLGENIAKALDRMLSKIKQAFGMGG